MKPRSPTPLLLSALLPVLIGLVAPTSSAQGDETVLARAFDHYNRMQDEEAMNLVNEFLVDEPLHGHASELRAELLWRARRFPEAVRTLQRLNHPPDRVKLLLAECLALTGELDQAGDIVDQVLMEDPSSLDARVSRGRILNLSGQFQRALNEFSGVRRERPEDAEALVGMAQSFEGMRAWAQATEMYLQFLGDLKNKRLGPHDPHIQRDAVEGLARVLTTQGLYEDAMTYYEQLVEHFPKNPTYRFRLGICQGMRNKFGDAIENVKMAVELDPLNLAFRARLADLHHSRSSTTRPSCSSSSCRRRRGLTSAFRCCAWRSSTWRRATSSAR